MCGYFAKMIGSFNNRIQKGPKTAPKAGLPVKPTLCTSLSFVQLRCLDCGPHSGGSQLSAGGHFQIVPHVQAEHGYGDIFFFIIYNM